MFKSRTECVSTFDYSNTRFGVEPYRVQFLKWVGNKQRFAHEIISFFPERFGTYHEPFLGSGAVLAVLAPKKAEASDSFKPLIEIWQVLRKDPEQIKRWYRERWEYLWRGEKVRQYEKIKDRFNINGNAADFLFLTRACYGGVIRFRKADGAMSTRCGFHRPIHPDTFDLRVDEWAKRVCGAEFFHREYVESLARARSGDVIYCDPPYGYGQAILYGAQEFNQDELFRCIERAKKRGVFVALSLDGTKKSGAVNCNYEIPQNLFARDVSVNCGRSMLKRFQMKGNTLERELVTDRLLLTH